MKTNKELNSAGLMVMFAVVLVIAASSILLYGLCKQPMGEISDWALWLFGNVLSAAAAIFGMDTHYRQKHKSDGAE